MNAHTPMPAPASITETVDLIGPAVRIALAYVAGNRLPPADVPEVVATAHRGLAALAYGRGAEPPPAAVTRPTPADIRRSIGPDGLVSFIDGRTYKALKRHLTAHGLGPHGYRERYGLPADYPMVAPAYSARRSAIARAIGLGMPEAHDAAPAVEAAVP